MTDKEIKKLKEAKRLLENSMSLLLSAMQEENTVTRSGPKVRSARSMCARVLNAVKEPTP